MADINPKYIIDPEGETDPTKKKKVILSIDGGGMRGAITLAMLAELEKQSGKTCQEMFDMFVGTSTGAIIAGGLAIGYSAQELLENKVLYRELLRKAFDKKTSQFWIVSFLFAVIVLALIIFAGACIYSVFVQKLFNEILAVIIFVACIVLLWFIGKFAMTDKTMFVFVLRVISNGFRFAYPLDPFIEIFSSILGEVNEKRKAQNKSPIHKIADIEEKIILTTAKNLETGETAFIVNAGAGKEKFKNWLLQDAVAASGSAPIFFDAYNNRLVDGGVSPFNNPCFAAAVEAMEYIGKYTKDNRQTLASEGVPAETLDSLEAYRSGNVILVSLGTGYPPDDIKKEEDVKKKNFFDWMRYIILESLDDSVNQQVYITRSLYRDAVDFRRFNVSLKQEHVKDLLESIDSDVLEKVGLSMADVPRLKEINAEELGLDTYNEDSVKLMECIGRMYGREINWSRKNTVPWDTDDSSIPFDRWGQPNPENDRTNNVKW